MGHSKTKDCDDLQGNTHSRDGDEGHELDDSDGGVILMLLLTSLRMLLKVVELLINPTRPLG